MSSTTELADNLARLLGPGLHAVPHDRFHVDASGWYILQTGFRFPAYAFAKLYLEDWGNDIFAGYYIEKGLRHTALGAPVAEPKLEMTDAWAWTKRRAAFVDGELEQALVAGARTAGVNAVVVCQADEPGRLSALAMERDYKQWSVLTDGSLAPREAGSPSPFDPALAQAKRIGDLYACVEGNPQRDWFWMDVLLGASFDRQVAVQTLAAFLRPFVAFL